jgi:ATP-dependent helicase Lhr and Lhr-like helicase
MSAIDSLDRRVATAFYGHFLRLREAQDAAIEPLTLGKNIVLSSGTGSGKTEAVVAPLVSKYWKSALESDALTILYITPTKALANDLEKRLQLPLSSMGLRVGIRHGDRDDLTIGIKPHILISTPESLDVMLFRREPALLSIRAIIIDEVHLLYNTQRGLQLSILLRRLQRQLPVKVQWAALSATIGDLPHIRDFLVGANEEAIYLDFPTPRPIDAQVRHVTDEGSFLELIRKLMDGKSTKLLIFANSRRECERLAGMLQHDDHLKHNVFAHYSSLSPSVRFDTEHKFATTSSAICIATSTLELGIDIGDIDAVLLWGVPGSIESFLQRIGRGNRRSSKTNAICLIPDDSSAVTFDALRFVTLIIAARKGELPIKAPFELFGSVGQQILSFIASDGGRFTRIADLCELVSHRTYLNRDVIENILAELASNGYLQRHGFKNQYGAEEDLHRLVDMKLIYGNFGVGSQSVDIYYSSKCLGEVPAINLMRLTNGTEVRFAGKCWRVQKFSRDGIHVQPCRSTSSVTDFSYGGKGIGTDSFIPDQIWRFVHSSENADDLLTKELRSRVASFRENIRSSCSYEQIPFRRTTNGICYYTFGGYLVNKAVGLASKKQWFRADDITLLAPSPINWTTIPKQPADYQEFFPQLFEASSEQSIYQQLLPIDLQQREFLQEWLKDETIPQILTRLGEGEPKLAETESLEILS